MISAKRNRLTLQDNNTIVADSFIYCTGYQWDFPFLDASTHVTYDHQHVEPLYKHMINAYHPTMMFLGMPTGFVITFSVYHIQVCIYNVIYPFTESDIIYLLVLYRPNITQLIFVVNFNYQV